MVDPRVGDWINWLDLRVYRHFEARIVFVAEWKRLYILGDASTNNQGRT
jgi:hypothetical protein